MSLETGDVLAGADAAQAAMMEEQCILVNDRDEIVGRASKKECHLNASGPLLHRAFSVFLFNHAGELLMQQRSNEKITFPAHWANTCCSHPLHVAREMEPGVGVKRAAQRKMGQELGIPATDIPLGCFTFVTRLHYKAHADDVWGEHEVDHVLVCRPPKDVRVSPNPNEVQCVRYFTAEELDGFLVTSQTTGTLVSPWLRLIHEKRLPQLWRAVVAGEIESVVEADVVHCGAPVDYARV